MPQRLFELISFALDFVPARAQLLQFGLVVVNAGVPGKGQLLQQPAPVSGLAGSGAKGFFQALAQFLARCLNPAVFVGQPGELLQIIGSQAPQLLSQLLSSLVCFLAVIGNGRFQVFDALFQPVDFVFQVLQQGVFGFQVVLFPGYRRRQLLQGAGHYACRRTFLEQGLVAALGVQGLCHGVEHNQCQ